jgi:hypothetical protein
MVRRASSARYQTVYDLLEEMADRRSVRPSFEDDVQNQRVLDAWERSAKKRRYEKV